MGNRILMVYGSVDGQTASIVERIATRLMGRGFRIDVFRGDVIPRKMTLAGFDGVIVAGPVRFGRFPRAIRKFVRRHVDSLGRVPSAFVAVSCAAASPLEEEKQEALDRIIAFLDATGWKPRLTVSLGGAILYRRYGPVTRRVMKAIAGRTGLDTDTTRNHEYTDWAAADRLSDMFADELDRSTSTQPVFAASNGPA